MEDVIKKKYESKKKSKFTDEIQLLQKRIETQEIVIQEMYNYMKLFSKCNLMNSNNQINNSEYNPINVVEIIQTSCLQIGDFIIKQDNDCLTVSQDSDVVFTISKNDPTLYPPFLLSFQNKNNSTFTN